MAGGKFTLRDILLLTAGGTWQGGRHLVQKLYILIAEHLINI
jgi:hypothetical protein